MTALYLRYKTCDTELDQIQKTLHLGLYYVALTVLLLALIIFPFVPNTLADTEPNDDFSQAELIIPGTYEGSLLDNDERDCYKITDIKPGQQLVADFTFVCEKSAGDMGTVIICGEDRVELVDDYDSSYDGIPNSVTASWTSSSAKSSYTYYILVDSYGDIANYTLNVSISECYDANSGTDADDSFENSLDLTPGDYEGYMYDMDEGDYYKVDDVKPGQEIRVKGVFTAVNKNSGASVDLALFDEELIELVSYFDATYDAPESITLSWTASSQDKSTYYVHVFGDYGFSYSLSVSVIDHFDADSEKDVGEDFETAYLIYPGAYDGHLGGSNGDVDDGGSSDEIDFYKINLDEPAIISVRLEPTSKLAIEAYIFDPDRAEIAYGYSSNVGAAMEIMVEAYESGSYFVKLCEYYDSYGDYSLKISSEELAEQFGTLDIYVKDDAGNTVSGVDITSISYPDGQVSLDGTTGSDGSVTFDDVKPGSYTFEASKSGYLTGTKTASVTAEAATEVNLTVEKETARGGGIPGFPYESIIAGLVLGALILMMLRRRQ